MTILNELLQYRNYFYYSPSYEAVRVTPFDEREKAVELYSKTIQNCLLRGDERWAFDIALDCLRTMSEEDIIYIANNKKIEEYHLNYGLYVRNKYVHSSRFHAYLDADKISSLVETFILGIICPDHFDKE